MTHKRYNDEFKLAAAKLVREQGYTLKKAAANLGVALVVTHKYRFGLVDCVK